MIFECFERPLAPPRKTKDPSFMSAPNAASLFETATAFIYSRKIAFASIALKEILIMRNLQIHGRIKNGLFIRRKIKRI